MAIKIQLDFTELRRQADEISNNGRLFFPTAKAIEARAKELAKAELTEHGSDRFPGQIFDPQGAYIDSIQAFAWDQGDGIGARHRTRVIAGVGLETNNAKWIEFGTGEYRDGGGGVIEPINGPALVFGREGKIFKLPFIQGKEAHHIMERATEYVTGVNPTEYDSTLDEAL